MQGLFGSKALKEAPASDWEGAPLMGMVPVGGWEAQNSREKSAHEGRQLIARSAYKRTRLGFTPLHAYHKFADGLFAHGVCCSVCGQGINVIIPWCGLPSANR